MRDICKKVSRRASGRKTKIFLKNFKSDKNFFSLIIGVKAGMVNNDYQVCKKLINEFRVESIIECDNNDEERVNKKFSNRK